MFFVLFIILMINETIYDVKITKGVFMTVREIAELIQCSPATVYRSLNTPDKVSSEINKKVQTLLNNFENNPLKILQVYIVLPQMNSFYNTLILVLTNILIKHNIQTIPFICDEDSQKEKEFLNSINFSSRMGLIWNPVDPRTKYSFLSRKNNRPKLVMLNRIHHIYKSEYSVSYADHEAMAMVIDILVQENAQNILLLSSNDLATAQARNDSFLNSIQKYPLIQGDILEVDFLNWKKAFQTIYQEKNKIVSYDSIIAGSESICYALLRFFDKEPELKQKIRLLTFDYAPIFEVLSLSMIFFPVELIAQKAIEFLINPPKEKVRYNILPQITLLGSENLNY